MKQCKKCFEIKILSDFRGSRSACRECDRAYRKNHYKDNREKYQEWHKAWSEANPDKIIEKNARRSKDMLRESHRKYIAAFPEKKKAYNHNYRARKMLAHGVLTSDVIKKVLDVHGKLCLACKSIQNIEIDHVVPLSLGGSNLFENLQPLCRSCNSTKGNRNSMDWRISNEQGAGRAQG